MDGAFFEKVKGLEEAHLASCEASRIDLFLQK